MISASRARTAQAHALQQTVFALGHGQIQDVAVERALGRRGGHRLHFGDGAVKDHAAQTADLAADIDLDGVAHGGSLGSGQSRNAPQELVASTPWFSIFPSYCHPP